MTAVNKFFSMVVFFLIIARCNAQQFDVTLTQNIGSYTYDDPAIFREFVTCKSVNPGRTISIGTVDGFSNPLRWFFIEVDSSGKRISSNCKEITASPYIRSIVLMDIKVLRNNSGYVACGYQFSNSDPYILKPLAVLFDNTGMPVKGYTYNDSGIFTKVIESPTGDFIFVGAKGNSTFIKNANRTAFIVKTYPNLIQNFNIIVPGIVSTESFDLISDVAMKSDDSLVVAGSITAYCNFGSGLRVQSVLMCLNPNNGVIHWQQNLFNTNYVSPKITLVKDTLYTVFNAALPIELHFVFFRLSTELYWVGA